MRNTTGPTVMLAYPQGSSCLFDPSPAAGFERLLVHEEHWFACLVGSDDTIASLDTISRLIGGALLIILGGWTCCWCTAHRLGPTSTGSRGFTVM